MAFSLALNVANPIWEAIDEPGHFQYIKFVAEQHRLPGGGDVVSGFLIGGQAVNCNNVRCLGRGTVTGEPPLFYALAAPFVLPINLNENISWVSNPYFTWSDHPQRNGVAVHLAAEAWPYRGMVLGVHVMRAVSGLMVAGALIAIYFLALTIGKRRDFALLVTAAGALTPGIVLSSATVNNDNGAILSASLALLLAVKAAVTSSRRWVWLILYGLATALALETKATAYFLLPVGLLLALLAAQEPNTRYRRATILTALGSLGLLGILAIRTTRSDVAGSLWSVQTTFTSMGGYWPCDCQLFAQRWWGAIPNFFETWWGSYGWETFHLPSPFYRPFLAVTLAALAGLCLAAARTYRARRVKQTLLSVKGRALLVLAVTFLTLFAMVNYRYWATHSDGGSTHGRLLFPALACVAVFLVVGLNALPRVLRAAGLLTLFCTCVAALGYSIYSLPQSFGPTVPLYGDPIAAGVGQPMNVPFVSNMTFAGWTPLDAAPVAPGATLHLRLYWQNTAPVDFDYSAFLRLHADGDDAAIIQAQDHGPGLGIGLLPHTWAAGEVIPDDWAIVIPPTAAPGTYQIELGLYDYRDLKPITLTDNRISVIIGTETIGRPH